MSRVGTQDAYDRAAESIGQIVIRLGRRRAQETLVQAASQQVGCGIGPRLLNGVVAIVEIIGGRAEDRLAHSSAQRIVRKPGGIVVRRRQPIARIPDVAVHAVRELVAVQVVRHCRRSPLRKLVVGTIRRI